MKCETLNEDYQHQLIIAEFTSKNIDSFSAVLGLFALVSGLSVWVLIVLPLMKKNHHIFHPVNPMAKSFLFSAMLQCWVWFVALYVYQFWALHLFQKTINTKSAVLSTAYMPFVNIGYYVFGIMGVFYLVEFPFLLWYISTKVMAMDRRGLNRRQCMLYMLKSVGCAGMVLFMQVLPVYFVFQIAFIFISPLYILIIYCSCIALLFLFTTCTALLFLPCIMHCIHCLPHCCLLSFFILSEIICIAFLIIIQIEFQADTFGTLYDLSHILTVLFTSGLLALLAYIIKRVFTHHKVHRHPQDTCSNEECKHLLHAV